MPLAAAGAATAVRPMASAASAVPRRARLLMLRVFILASSRRIIVAADYANACVGIVRRTQACRAGNRCAEAFAHRSHSVGHLRLRLGGHRAALEARHVAAGR